MRESNVRAKPTMMEFDRVLARAEASLAPLPMKVSLFLAEDEEHRAGDWDDTAEFGLSDRRFRKRNESVSVVGGK